MKVMIAIPSTGYMHYEFVDRLQKLTQHLSECNDISFGVEIHGGTLVHLAREELMRKAINGGYSHILWIDSDMIFDELSLDRLKNTMETEKCDLVSGIFRSRHGGLRSCLFKTLQPDERIEDFPREAFSIEGCGMAFTLVKIELCHRIQDAYGHCFLPTAMYGEDLAFCFRAKELGCKMMANPDVKVGHMANGILWPDKNFDFI